MLSYSLQDISCYKEFISQGDLLSNDSVKSVYYLDG